MSDDADKKATELLPCHYYQCTAEVHDWKCPAAYRLAVAAALRELKAEIERWKRGEQIGACLMEIERLKAELEQAAERQRELEDALRKIAQGDNSFGPMQGHNMREIARAILAQAEVKK